MALSTVFYIGATGYIGGPRLVYSLMYYFGALIGGMCRLSL